MENTPEKAFDDITDLAALICETSVALVSLVDDGQQRFESRHGIDAGQAPRLVHFCEQSIAQPNDLFVIPDVGRDERFADEAPGIDDTAIRF